MVLITIVNGVYKPAYNWGGPHVYSILFNLCWWNPDFVVINELLFYHMCCRSKARFVPNCVGKIIPFSAITVCLTNDKIYWYIINFPCKQGLNYFQGSRDHGYSWVMGRNFIVEHLLTKKMPKKYFKFLFQYLENEPLNVLNLILDIIYG